MSEPFVISLDTIRQSDSHRVGGKAAILGELLAAGFPVPAGLCITTDTFHQGLADYQAAIQAILQGHDLRDIAAAQAAATIIAQLLEDLVIPVPVIDTLQSHLPHIAAPTVPLAVRSSATAEDQVEASYAGQYTTILGAQGIAAVEKAILTCWRSFFSANALVARAANGALGATEGMAVLIQPVIEAECAGVAFSVDPVQARKDRQDLVVINAAWGLGVGVVDGTVASDTIWVQQANFQVERQDIREKSEAIRLGAAGALEHVAILDERRRAACLPPAWVERIAQVVVAAETHLGRPQDMEWAIAEGQLWVLQSRPLTGLPTAWTGTPPFPVTWEADEDPQVLWRRWQESETPPVLLPLEQDHLVQLESTWEDTCRMIGVERKQQFKYCNGRAYTRPMPIHWTAADRRIRRTAMADLHERLQAQGLTAWEHWGPEIVKATERLRAFDRDTADGSALADHLEEALAVRRRHYIYHPFMVFNPPQPFFTAYAALAGVSAEEAEIAAYHLLDVGETPLTQLTDHLYQLAKIARQDQAIAALITQPPPDVVEQIRRCPQGSAFLTQWEALLTIYGERTGDGWGSELTLRAPTWREQPIALLRLLTPLLDPTVEAPEIIRQRMRQQREAAVEALCTACADQGAVAEFRCQLAYACKTHAVLELHNHYIDQMSIGQLRHAVMAAARWLAKQGALVEPEDVLWLRFQEILDALRTDSTSEFTALITTRQAEHSAWLHLKAPAIVGIPACQLPERPPFQDEVTPGSDGIAPDNTGRLLGLGASPGQRRGKARIMHDPLALPAQLVPGDILVAENVGPLWTPIFPMLGGLVLESGSMGQHAAATAREYGVPTVIHVKQARQRIPDESWILVDGTQGEVELGD